MSELNQDHLTRRTFLQTGVVAGSAMAASIVSDRAESSEKQFLKKGTVILFQGDSITDAGRDRKRNGPNASLGLGRGYPCLLAGALLADDPEAELTVYNRGISGNKVPDLAKRWQDDTIALKPDVLSILVGVNDIWHKLNGRYDGTVADYETGYRDLLRETFEKLPGVRIVICEPYVLRCGAVNDTWFPEFDQRRAVARKLADEFRLTFVSFQKMFDEASRVAPPKYWSADGVHPTLAGHALMAKTWRQVAGL